MRSAAKRRAAESHIEATAGTVSGGHMEDGCPNTRRTRAAILQDNAKGTLAKKTGSWMGVRLQVKARGKLAKKTGSKSDEACHSEEHPDETGESRNEELLPCAFIVNYIWIYAHHICCWPNA